MKVSKTVAFVALLVAGVWPAFGQMQGGNGGMGGMGGMMGGGRRTMINLVSPANSPIQIRRGVVMVGAYMFGMGQQGGMMGSPSGDDGVSVGLRVMLRLYGVATTSGLVSSTGNHFILEGRLITADGEQSLPPVNELFDLSNGSAYVQVPLTVPPATGATTLAIDRIEVTDDSDVPFAVFGVLIPDLAAQPTPHPTFGGACTQNSQCDDGDPNTQDICTPMGCQHMPNHGGPGMH